VTARDFKIDGKRFEQMQIAASGICHDSGDLQNCEYVVWIKWLVSKKREDLCGSTDSFTRSNRASMANQQKTLDYIEQE